MTTTPEQLAKWREAGEQAWSEDLSVDMRAHPQTMYAAGYLRRCQETEQIMKLAKFGAMVMCDFQNLTITKINNHALKQDFIGNGSEVKPSIEATIKELLK